ncbi:GlcG/HbpS family heme-binding protein [Microvirga antarctica]|uniref:GlcG/HbpS family heme-binding protein n=1 Tax=Microvirga antarctica TaxID=2819233 RepID=UPI001B30BB5B|nr:heme-binding protein [Microvirga antarctica]
MALSRGVCAAILVGTLTTPAGAQLIAHKDLALDTALVIATTAASHCKAQGYTVSVAVVGREAQILVHLRGDRSPPHSIENSFRRAYTALTYRQPSVNIERRVRADPGDELVLLNHIMPAQGGLPVIVDGDTIGAVAVSGSPGGEKDEACAQAGLDRAADLLK